MRDYVQTAVSVHILTDHQHLHILADERTLSQCKVCGGSIVHLLRALPTMPDFLVLDRKYLDPSSDYNFRKQLDVFCGSPHYEWPYGWFRVAINVSVSHTPGLGGG